MIAHRPGHADIFRRALGLKSCGDIYHVAVQISPIGDRIANGDPDTKAHGAIRLLVSVVDRDVVLDRDRAVHRTVDAVEGDEQRIPAGLHHPAAMFGNGGVDDSAAEAPETMEGSRVVQLDEAAVTDHICIQDDSELRPVWRFLGCRCAGP
jgi:hypothetical protein